MTELKPCPFCPDGGDPKHLKIVYHSCESNLVKCMKCEAATCGYTTEQEAIAAWNQRVEPAYKAGCKDGYKMGKSEVRTCKNKSRTALRFVCSRCEEVATVYCEEDFGDVVNHSSIINYCPNCGAKVVE